MWSKSSLCHFLKGSFFLHSAILVATEHTMSWWLVQAIPRQCSPMQRHLPHSIEYNKFLVWLFKFWNNQGVWGREAIAKKTVHMPWLARGCIGVGSEMFWPCSALLLCTHSLLYSVQGLATGPFSVWAVSDLTTFFFAWSSFSWHSNNLISVSSVTMEISCWRELIAIRANNTAFVTLFFFPPTVHISSHLCQLFNCQSSATVLILPAFQVEQLCGALVPCQMSSCSRGTCWSHNCERGGFHLCSVKTKPSLTSSRCCSYSRLWIFWPKHRPLVSWFLNYYVGMTGVPPCKLICLLLQRTAVSLKHDKVQPHVLTCSSLRSNEILQKKEEKEDWIKLPPRTYFLKSQFSTAVAVKLWSR